jgi:pimeloyl-ACP methyl ester carboxylesterase
VFLIVKYFTLETSADEIQFVTAPDGVRLALHRYRPAGAPRFREPVILCHGLAMNRFLFEFGGEPSLARYLRDRGFDVWVAEYCGSGMSTSPHLFDRRTTFWNLDDIIYRDVATFIKIVSQMAGGAPVHWIGHSTGGVVILCHLGLNPNSPVASVVAMGTPAQFERMKSLAVVHHALTALTRFRVVRIKLISAVIAAGWLTFRFWPFRNFLEALLNPANVSPYLLRRALVNLLANPLSPLLLQYSTWIRTGLVRSADGKINYFDSLGRIRTPVLLLYGAADHTAPPTAGQWLHDQLTCEQKQIWIASQTNGTRQDYGHGDLLLGQHAVEEIFPVLRRWLADRSTPSAEIHEGASTTAQPAPHTASP